MVCLGRVQVILCQHYISPITDKYDRGWGRAEKSHKICSVSFIDDSYIGFLSFLVFWRINAKVGSTESENFNWNPSCVLFQNALKKQYRKWFFLEKVSSCFKKLKTFINVIVLHWYWNVMKFNNWLSCSFRLETPESVSPVCWRSWWTWRQTTRSSAPSGSTSVHTSYRLRANRSNYR